MAVLGLLSSEFPAASLEENLSAMRSTGAIGVQFDMMCAVGETLPSELSDGDLEAVARGFQRHGLDLSALSGTYNMIDPDPAKREAGAERLDRLIAVASQLGARVVTLCTGSRDPRNMWQPHPANNSEEAWTDLLASAERAVRTAERYGVTLGVETEVGNTVNTVRKARNLLDQISSRNLKIVMDGANIFKRGELPHMRSKLDEAFELLGDEIVLAHAKDLDHDGEAGHVPAGLGRLDYPCYLQLLQASGYGGAIILHALRPEQAESCLAFVRRSAPVGYIGERE